MKKFLTLYFALSCLYSLAQGFNNEKDYDKKDIAVLFKEMKMEVFKFSFKSKIDSSLNVVVKQYYKGKLQKTHDFYYQQAPFLAMGDEPLNFYFPKLNDSVAQTIRFYLKQEKNKLVLNIQNDHLEDYVNFNTTGFDFLGNRAYDFIPEFLSDSSQPLFVYYGNKNVNFLGCPGDAEPQKILKMYDFVLVAYATFLNPANRKKKIDFKFISK